MLQHKKTFSRFHKTGGFTLIELMLVVAIIGILAYISVTKFAELINKSKQAATKGHLGILRSAMKIYYGDNDGVYPTTLAALITTPGYKGYIDTIPNSELVIHQTTDDEYDGTEINESAGSGRWFYNQDNGAIKVNCTHTDLTGSYISTW